MLPLNFKNSLGRPAWKNSIPVFVKQRTIIKKNFRVKKEDWIIPNDSFLCLLLICFFLKSCTLSIAALGHYLKWCQSRKAQQKRARRLQMNTNITGCPVKSQQLPDADHSKSTLGCINFSVTGNIFQSMCKTTCPLIHQSARWTFINLLLLFLSSFFLGW